MPMTWNEVFRIEGLNNPYFDTVKTNKTNKTNTYNTASTIYNTVPTTYNIASSTFSKNYTKNHVPEVKKIIFNNPATIVFWKDGTKTVVKAMQDEEFSKYWGFLAALSKKLYGSHSHVDKIIETYGVEQP